MHLTSLVTPLQWLAALYSLSFALKCHGNKTVAGFFADQTYCMAYYDFKKNDCKNFKVDYGTISVTRKLTDKCGHLMTGVDTVIICFCSEDYCNTLENMKEILKNTTKMSIIRGMPLTSQPRNDTGIEMFRCLKRSLGIVEPGNGPDDNEGLPSTLFIVLPVLVCIVLLMGGIVLHWAKRKQKREEEEQLELAKKSAEQLSHSSTSEESSRYGDNRGPFGSKEILETLKGLRSDEAFKASGSREAAKVSAPKEKHRIGYSKEKLLVGGSMETVKMSGSKETAKVSAQKKSESGGSKETSRVEGSKGSSRVGDSKETVRLSDSREKDQVGGSKELSRVVGSKEVVRMSDSKETAKQSDPRDEASPIASPGAPRNEERW